MRIKGNNTLGYTGFVFALGLVVTFTSGGILHAADNPGQVVEKPGIVYNAVAGDKGKLDLYLPTGTAAGLRPGVLLVHGGGWRAGERGQWRKLALLLAGRGYVCASTSYRLAPEFKLRTQIADVRRAMDFVKAHAGDWGLDPQRIGAVGSSAGGHLVALLATIAPGDSLGDPEHKLSRDTRPRAVACYNPVLDFTAEGRIWPSQVGLFDMPGPEADADYALTSPALRVRPGLPPFLFLYGDRDILTPEENGRRMVSALDSLGVPVQVAMFHGMEHGFGYSLSPGESLRAAGVVAEFFDRILK